MSAIADAWNGLGQHRRTLVFAGTFAFIFGVPIIALCWALDATPAGPGTNLLICILGALAGWAVGMFFSPFDEVDVARFKYIGKSVAAFVSGYLVSKIDAPLAEFFKNLPSNWTPGLGVRFGLFASSFLLAALVVFVTRAYAPAKEKPKE